MESDEDNGRMCPQRMDVCVHNEWMKGSVKLISHARIVQ